MPATYIGSSDSHKRYRNFKRNLAVVIGINDYTKGIRPLYTAHNDALRIAKLLLCDHSFSVLLFIAPASAESLQADLTPEQNGRLTICGLAEKTSLEVLLNITLPNEVNTIGTDRLIFYFAGHGIKLEDKNEEGPRGYLIPVDASQDNSDSFLPMLDLYKALMALKTCHHLLLILDCCFAGAIRWSIMREMVTPRQKITWQRYQMFVESPAWQAITSSAYNQLALDSVFGQRAPDEQNQSNSPFALALIEALQGKADTFPPGEMGQPAGDGLLTAQELHQYIRDQVQLMAKEQADHTQAPGLWPMGNHQNGEFVFQVPGRNLSLSPDLPASHKIDPYRSLEPYSEEHSQIFFGRAKATEELAKRVRENRFTVVLGASGVGKSSLVKAGLLPALRKDHAITWQIMLPLPVAQANTKGAPRPAAPMTPTESPLTRLAAVVQSSLSLTKPLDLKKDDSPAQLVTLVKTWLSTHEKQMLLLVIDQFEEMVTRCHDQGERKQMYRLLGALLALENRYNFRLVLTLRSDFEPRFAALPEFAIFWEKVPPGEDHKVRYVTKLMTRQELREVIERPAAEYALYFKPYNLVDSILNDVEQMPGALPLLSFTLSLLYQKFREHKGDDRALTEEDYRAIGGVIGALSTQAERVYHALGNGDEDRSHQETMQRILIRMLSIEGGIAVKRPVPWVSSEGGVATDSPRNELHYSEPIENQRVKTVIEALVDARLITVDTARDGTTVQPAHDALIEAWERIDQWRRKERDEIILLQRRVTDATNEWMKAAHPRRLGSSRSVVESVLLLYDYITTSGSEGRVRLLWHNNSRLPQVQELLESKQNSSDTWLQRQFRGWQARFNPQPLIPRLPFWLNKIELDFVEQSLNRQRWNRLFSAGIIIGVLILFAGLSLFADFQRRIAVTREQEALLQVRISRAGQLAALSQAVSEFRPVEKLLMSLHALKLTTQGTPNFRSPLAEQALHDALHQPIGLALVGHTNTINKVDFSPNRNLLASASQDFTVRLWNADDLSISARVLPCHSERVNDVRFSNDGTLLASVSDDGTLCVWDIDTLDHPLYQSNARNGGIETIAFSPNGLWLATINGDLTIGLWHTNNLDSLPFLLPVSSEINDIAFGSNNRLLVGAGRDSKVYFWDLEQIEDIQTPSYFLEGYTSAITALSFSLDGTQLIAGGITGTLTIWTKEHNDVQFDNQPLILSEHTDPVSDIEFSPNQQIIATASYDKSIFLWGREDLQAKPRKYEGHLSSVGDLSFSPNGEWLASTSLGSSVQLIDLREADPQPQMFYSHEFSVGTVDFSYDSRWFATGGTGGTIRLWDPLNVAIDPFVLRGHQAEVNFVVFDKSGEQIASASSDHTVRVWKAGNLRLQPTILIGHQAEVNSVAFHPNGNLLASGSNDYAIRIWDLQKPNDAIVILDDHQRAVNAVAFNPSGTLLASGAEDKIVRLWDTKDWSQVGELTGHEFGIKSLDFNPAGNLLASGSWDSTIRLWDIQDLSAEPHILRGHQFAVNALDFNSDGTQLVSASEDGTLRLWDMQTLDSDPLILYRQSLLRDVAFSPDDHWLVSVGWGSNDVYLWDLDNPDATPRRLRYHQGLMTAANFSPNGRWIVSASQDETILVWSALLQDTVSFACQIVGRNLTQVEWQQYFGTAPYEITCPNLAAHSTAVQAILDLGKAAAEEGRIEEALVNYDHAWQLSPEMVLAEDWNTLCWFGSLYGFAYQVIDTCDNAVQTAEPDEKASYVDSRGLARALTGNEVGAIEDFVYFVEWATNNNIDDTLIKQREQWIAILRAGGGPFDTATLVQLRNE